MQEFLFSYKNQIDYWSSTLYLIYKSKVTLASAQKYIGLNVQKWKMNNAIKGVSFPPNLQFILPHLSLLTICKSFMWPPIDYRHVSHKQSYIVSSNTMSVQYNTALAIPGVIQVSPRGEVRNWISQSESIDETFELDL